MKQPHFITAHITGDAAKFLRYSDEVSRLVTMKQTPINVLFPSQIVHNYKAYKNVGNELGIQTEVYYAHKPNKSHALVHELASLPSSKIDVASLGELRSALSAGFSGTRIEVTGPKSRILLMLAMQHGATLNCDSLGELHQIIQLHRLLEITAPIPIFLRLADPTGASSKDTRFGLAEQELNQALDLVVKHKSLLQFRGFSYHLNSYTPQTQCLAFSQVLHKTIQATERGLQPNAVNIGGGLRINYVAHAKEWHAYESAIKQGVLGNSPTMGWNKSGLGWRSQNGTLTGGPRYMPFYQQHNQYQQLKTLLTTYDESLGGTYADLLRDLMLTLCIEPGRSLLDMCGVTLTTVQDIKRSLYGETIVVLDMNRSQLDSFEQEYMLDPIVISQQPQGNSAANMSVFFAGNLCLASDFISHRRIYLTNTVQVGDIIAFTNTAGYFMDFAESTTLKQRIAPKVAVTYHHGHPILQDDETYITMRIK